MRRTLRRTDNAGRESQEQHPRPSNLMDVPLGPNTQAPTIHNLTNVLQKGYRCVHGSDSGLPPDY